MTNLIFYLSIIASFFFLIIAIYYVLKNSDAVNINSPEWEKFRSERWYVVYIIAFVYMLWFISVHIYKRINFELEEDRISFFILFLSLHISLFFFSLGLRAFRVLRKSKKTNMVK